MSKTDAALVGATLLALAGSGWWLMDGWIAAQGWAAWTGTGNQWAITATGWRLFGQAWPVALAGTVLGVTVLWPVLAWATHRRAEADLAGRRGDIERQSQALNRKQQAMEQDKRESQSRLDALRQELSNIHARRMAEIEAGSAKARTAQENALAEATGKTRLAEARADMAEKQLEKAERGRKNAAWVAARLKNKIAQSASEPPTTPCPRG